MNQILVNMNDDVHGDKIYMKGRKGWKNETLCRIDWTKYNFVIKHENRYCTYRDRESPHKKRTRIILSNNSGRTHNYQAIMCNQKRIDYQKNVHGCSKKYAGDKWTPPYWFETVCVFTLNDEKNPVCISMRK